MKEHGVPNFLPLLPRTRSDDLTAKMYSVDHRLVKSDGPPDIRAEDFVDEEDTNVDEVNVVEELFLYNEAHDDASPSLLDSDGVVDKIVCDTLRPYTSYP
jgi:hypothetical protein